MKAGTEEVSSPEGESGGGFRDVVSSIVRAVNNRRYLVNGEEARWMTYSSEGIAAAAGSEHIANLTSEALDYEDLERSHRAIAETPGSWADESTFIATMERYHAFRKS